MDRVCPESLPRGFRVTQAANRIKRLNFQTSPRDSVREVAAVPPHMVGMTEGLIARRSAGRRGYGVFESRSAEPLGYDQQSPTAGSEHTPDFPQRLCVVFDVFQNVRGD